MRKRREHNCIYRALSAWALVLCLLAALCVSPAALAIDQINEDASCSLTVQFHPGGINGDGAKVQLYRVADMTGFGHFTPCGRFAAFSEPVNGLEDEQWDVLAHKLISFADAQTPIVSPMAEGTISGGKTTFDGLPVGLYLITFDVYARDRIYYITSPMLVSLPNHSDPADPDAWRYSVELSPKPNQINAAPLRVQKVWQDAKASEWKPVTIHLMVNSKVAETVVLSVANNWRANFATQLKAGDRWSVVEATQLSGFKTPTWDWNWDGRYINIYVTNQKKPPYTPPSSGPTPTPKPNYPPVLPQTGLLWWPVPVLAVGGMMLFALGWIRRRHHD